VRLIPMDNSLVVFVDEKLLFCEDVIFKGYNPFVSWLRRRLHSAQLSLVYTLREAEFVVTLLGLFA
jgi:hypothetical protein